MSTDTYLVLRVTGTKEEVYDPLRPQTWRKGIAGEPEGALEYQVESLALDASDYREARSDPRVAGLARPMPPRLNPPAERRPAPVAPPGASTLPAPWRAPTLDAA